MFSSIPKINNDNFLETNEKCYSYEDIEKIANFLQEKITIRPKIGIICGSGLGKIAEIVENPSIFPYKNIPNFPISTIQSHAGNLLFGKICKIPVVCMQGRFHYYEGYPLWKCVMPVRLMKILGIEYLIASNAAGGLNSNLNVGDIMLIKDHFNIMGFAGNNPLRGPNDARFGPQFVSMNNAYDLDILEDVKLMCKNSKLNQFIKEGVYTCMGGPNFETVAELKILKQLDVDAVGMSTVHEVIAARHCGIVCFAFSLITNLCIPEYGIKEEPNVDDILEAAKQREEDLKVFVAKVVKYLGEKN